jgi:hypothetical protein
MSSAKREIPFARRVIRAVFPVAAVVAAGMLTAVPAFADGWRHHRHHHYKVGVFAPAYGYYRPAPRVVYVAPPPVIYAPPPRPLFGALSFAITIPLH